jgi:outer membrane protein assembly factor BamE (lipoprotein component of BamABCDE complex)
MMALMARGFQALAVIAVCLASACTTQYRNHGYVPREAELARVDLGDSRGEVETLIGRPTTTGLLEDDGWFYVRSRYRDYAWRAPAEIDREVVVVSFAGDAVSNIERYGLRDGRVVPLSRRVTDQSTTGTPFLRQIFGNLGNFNPADFFDDGNV